MSLLLFKRRRTSGSRSLACPGGVLSALRQANTYEFRISSPVLKWAALDQPGWIGRAFDDPSELANWVGRIQKCLLSREVLYSVNYPELSIPLKEGRNPGFLVITVLENAPTKGPAFAEYLKNELIPAYKKAGVDGVGVSRRRFGTNSRHWLIITFLDKMEELDEPHPLAKSLGEENWRELRRKGGALSVRSERYVFTPQPDLTFVN